ncbi:MAG: ABC transporter permease [Endomicrobiaceae bacterium]|nr:ABC transporter permease [Endomicrobiaceae bacterium]
MKLFIRRILSISMKEYKHILRDPFTFIAAVGIPVFFVVFFGFIIDLDYKGVSVNVRDNDQTESSRRFLQMTGSSGYFNLIPVHQQSQADKKLNENDMSSIMIIPKGFGKEIKNGSGEATIQLIIDGTDNAKAGIINSYISLVADKASSVFSKNDDNFQKPYFNVKTRFLFNPELNSRWFIVPGLGTVIIGLIAILLTALTVAKEWENGSMELLLATPVSAAEIVLGKLIPYFVLAFFDILLIFIFSILVFDIPFRGSFIFYILSSVIYIAGALALGLLISVITRKQEQATQIAFAVGVLPSFILSGFIFPIENMPLFFRILTAIFPQRWFMQISRSVFLSDSGFAELMIPFFFITCFAAVMIFVSIKKFKKDLEVTQ